MLIAKGLETPILWVAGVGLAVGRRRGKKNGMDRGSVHAVEAEVIRKRCFQWPSSWAVQGVVRSLYFARISLTSAGVIAAASFDQLWRT